jgi:hypothetical protein
MMRYFFDYRATEKILYDYQGAEFHSSQSAIEFAEATAQHLRDSLAGEWSSWSIEVRSPEGKKFLSLPIGAAASIAA